jgi:hypothetical protein
VIDKVLNCFLFCQWKAILGVGSLQIILVHENHPDLRNNINKVGALRRVQQDRCEEHTAPIVNLK